MWSAKDVAGKDDVLTEDGSEGFESRFDSSLVNMGNVQGHCRACSLKPTLSHPLNIQSHSLTKTLALRQSPSLLKI